MVTSSTSSFLPSSERKIWAFILARAPVQRHGHFFSFLFPRLKEQFNKMFNIQMEYRRIKKGLGHQIYWDVIEDAEDVDQEISRISNFSRPSGLQSPIILFGECSLHKSMVSVQSSHVLFLPKHLFPLASCKESVQIGRITSLAKIIQEYIVFFQKNGRFPRQRRQHQGRRGEMARTLVITYTNPGLDWDSLGEVVPSLERQWAMTQDQGHQVDFFQVGKDSLLENLSLFLKAQKIVFISLCPYRRFADLIIFLRTQLPTKADFIIHLYDNATIGAWRFHALGFGRHLRSSDVFIATSKGDQLALRHCFINASSVVIPFALAHDIPIPERVDLKTVPIVYVGRISEQKMIHHLLVAMWLVKNSPYPSPSIKLYLWGKEDQLGSPNMGVNFPNYLAYLLRLRKALNLEYEVIFQGHIPRDELYLDHLDFKHVFVSSGLHSDENFGMAAFRSLFTGNLAVLSDWGGHKELKRKFPSQVSMVKVYGSAEGPFIDVHELASTLVKTAGKFRQHVQRSQNSLQSLKKRLPHSEMVVHQSYKKLAKRAKMASVGASPLHLSPTAARILKQRKDLSLNVDTSLAKHLENRQELEILSNKIFTHYGDPLVRPFFASYGMPARNFKCPSRFLIRYSQMGGFYLLPWVTVTENGIHIDDPHKGVHSRTISHRKGALIVYDLGKRPFRIPRKDLKWLIERGLVFVFSRKTFQQERAITS